MRPGTKLGILLAGLSLALSGCYAVELENLNRINKAALLAVDCSTKIDTSQFEGPAADLNKWFQSDQFDLTPVAEKIKANFFTQYTGLFPFQILPEEKVIQSPAYLADVNSFAGQMRKLFRVSNPQGYTWISKNDYKKMAELTSQITDADGSIVISTSFVLQKKGEILGFGSAAMRSLIRVCVRTKDNMNAVSLIEEGESKSVIKYALGGVFDASQLKDLCMESTEIALVNCYQSLQRQIAYHRERLAKEGKNLPLKPAVQAPPPAPVAQTDAPAAPVPAAPAPVAPASAAPASTAPIVQPPQPVTPYAPMAANRVKGRYSVRAFVGEHQFLLEDLNRSVIQSSNDIMVFLSTDPTKTHLMGEIKNTFGATLQLEYGMTDNILITAEYTYLPVERTGQTLVSGMDYLIDLNLPLNEFGLGAKLAVPAGGNLLFKFGAGIQTVNLYGWYSQEARLSGQRVSYIDTNLKGNCLGANLTSGIDLFFTPNIVFGLELGYRMATINSITDSQGQVLKFTDTGKNMEINLTGMITRGGLVIYF